jgi:hypothetical protein
VIHHLVGFLEQRSRRLEIDRKAGDARTERMQRAKARIRNARAQDLRSLDSDFSASANTTQNSSAPLRATMSPGRVAAARAAAQAPAKAHRRWHARDNHSSF